MVTRPVARVWRGITEVDDLEDENRELQQQLDAQRSDQIAAQNALIENRQLRALLDLESLAAIPTVTGEIIGQSPSNFDQRVEIDRGSLDGIQVGMPVINSAGLVGKITNVFPETSIVMLVTDPQYHVPVKVVAEVLPTPATSGRPRCRADCRWVTSPPRPPPVDRPRPRRRPSRRRPADGSVAPA